MDNSVRVLIVDDDEELRQNISMLLKISKSPTYEVSEAQDGEEALHRADIFKPDIVLMDVEMPGTDGDVTTQRLLRKHPALKIIAHTGHAEPEVISRMLVAGVTGYHVKGDPFALMPALEQVMAGARPISKDAMPGLLESVIQMAREQKDRADEIESLHRDLQDTYKEVVLSLAEALRTRDEETQDHVERVVNMSVRLGKALGLDERDLEDVRHGAIFHDLGKLGVPDYILYNKDDLSKEEWEIIRNHTIIGEKILYPIQKMRNAARIVRSTHENFDGTGYPDALRGDVIPLASRIIRVADSFDAMTSTRPYQTPLTPQEALARIQDGAGKAFDPRVVEALEKEVMQHA